HSIRMTLLFHCLCLPASNSDPEFFFSSRRRHTRFSRDWSSDVCSSDLGLVLFGAQQFRSQVHKRVVGNAGTGLYGRMDMDELARSEERRVGKECRSGWSTER